MPELPEVETVALTLRPQLAGSRVRRVAVLHPDAVAGLSPEDFTRALAGARFEDVSRRGKYLLFSIRPAGGEPLRLVFHLRMTGRLVCVPAAEEAPKHTHLRFELDDGRELRFVDSRRFGRAYLLPHADPPKGLLGLGPEPLAARFRRTDFAAMLAGRRRQIKALLLDQSFLAGLGNIYADEALFRAGVDPKRRACDLTARETSRLFRSVRAVLREAIAAGGTTIRDYVDGRGREGEFAARLRVYGREGRPCPLCGATIERHVVAGRSTYVCPRCQPG